MQNHYNLVYREEEREMIPLCRAKGIGVIPWSPLARGFLAGNRTRGRKDATRARTARRLRSRPLLRRRRLRGRRAGRRGGGRQGRAAHPGGAGLGAAAARDHGADHRHLEAGAARPAGRRPVDSADGCRGRFARRAVPAAPGARALADHVTPVVIHTAR